MGSVPDMKDMSSEYQQAVLQSRKARKPKGLKGVLSLHACIMQKKQRGEWQGPETPNARMSSNKEEFLQKAIQNAPGQQQPQDQQPQDYPWRKSKATGGYRWKQKRQGRTCAA